MPPNFTPVAVGAHWVLFVEPGAGSARRARTYSRVWLLKSLDTPINTPYVLHYPDSSALSLSNGGK